MSVDVTAFVSREEMRPMAKNVIMRDDQRIDGRYAERKPDSSPLKGVRREILFPTEATTIDRKKIDRAIARVISKKK